jgi:hypothetical protein
MSATVPITILDRVAFCSDACMHNAFEGDLETGYWSGVVPLNIARTIKCYACGFYLDNAAENTKPEMLAKLKPLYAAIRKARRAAR